MQRLFNIFLLIICLCFFVPLTEAKEIKFIQISDLSFNSDENSVENYKKAVNKINKTKDLDFVVFTGGNLAFSNADLLKEFLKISKKIKRPYYIQIGTSDCQKNQGITKEKYIKLLNKYSNRHYKSFNYVVKKGNVVLVFVDGSKQFIPTTGYYKADTVIWLDKVLTKYEDKNIVIFQYFPLYKADATVNTHLHKPDIYFDVLKKHKNVIAVFSGALNGTFYDVYEDNVLHSTAKPAYVNSSNYKEIYLNDNDGGKYEIYMKDVDFNY